MVVVVILILMNWYIPTRIQIDLTVNRACFTVGGTDSIPILNSVSFQSITVEKFSSIKLEPDKLEVADPDQYILSEDRYPKSAWKSLKVTPPMIITGYDKSLQPKVTFESARYGFNITGALDRVWASPHAEITIETRIGQTSNITIKVDNKESTTVLSIREPFQLMTDYGQILGITEIPFQVDSLTYRAQLHKYNPFIEITSQPRSLVLNLTIPSEKIVNLFSEGGIPVSSLSFIRQDETGNPVTTLVKEKKGEITFPDYPKIDKMSFRAPDFVGLDRLEKFRIEEIVMDPEHKGIRFLLNGIAGHVKTGSPEFQKDHRLTHFDTLWQNPRLMVLFSIIIWVFPTTVGGYRLYKEFKG